jgi:hypothetical protein
MDHLYLYTRPGCDLCDEARSIVERLLAERTAAGLPSPTLIERDIDTNDDWQRAFLASIPVIELGEQRLELAVSAVRIRRLLTDVLDATAPAPTAPRG